MGVTVHVLAIEVAGIDRFAVTADGQAILFRDRVLGVQGVQHHDDANQKDTSYQFRSHHCIFKPCRKIPFSLLIELSLFMMVFGTTNNYK
jgi:hypothetical protein